MGPDVGLDATTHVCVAVGFVGVTVEMYCVLGVLVPFVASLSMAIIVDRGVYWSARGRITGSCKQAAS